MKLHNDYDLDFFIHSWSKEHEKNISSILQPRKKKFEKQIHFKVPYNRYRNQKLENYRSLYKAYENVDKIIEKEIYLTHSRWYSTKQSLTLMKEHVEQTGTDYDWVLQLRFDIKFFKPLPFFELDSKYFYSPYRENEMKIAVNDLFFISSYNNALKFSTLHDNILNYCVRAPVAAKEHMAKNRIEHLTLFEVAKDFHLLRYLSNVNNEKKNKQKKNIKYYLYRIKRFIQRNFSV